MATAVQVMNAIKEKAIASRKSKLHPYAIYEEQTSAGVVECLVAFDKRRPNSLKTSMAVRWSLNGKVISAKNLLAAL